MSPAKIVRIINVVVVLGVALVPAIPMGGLWLALAGLVLGYYVASDNRVSLVVLAVFLGAGGDGALDAIPAIGDLPHEHSEQRRGGVGGCERDRTGPHYV